MFRTSPAHGVGFDIAGENRADESAMRDAIYLALDVVRSRRLYAAITANPLQKYKRTAAPTCRHPSCPMNRKKHNEYHRRSSYCAG